VIDAADAAFLVAAEEQRRAPVGTIGLDEPDFALGVAIGDQVLTQEAHAQRGAITFGQFFRKAHRPPEAAEIFPALRSRADPCDAFIFLDRQHTDLLLTLSKAQP
jgi:hypothetical protein